MIKPNTVSQSRMTTSRQTTSYFLIGHMNQSAEGAGGLGIIRSNKVGKTE